MSLFDTGIRPAVDAWLLEKSKEVRSYGDYWSASSAGYCQRKVIFERLGVPHIVKDDDARKQRLFTAGHLFHDWIQGITKEAGLSIAQEVELQDEDLMIRGHFDDLILIKGELKILGENATQELPDHLILYDYKTVNSRSFMWAKKNNNAMNHSHRMQLGTYMYMLRKGKENYINVINDSYGGSLIQYDMLGELSEARILKIEKENLMMGEQQLLWSDQLYTDILDYWVNLNRYWKEKKIPPCTCADHDGGFMALEKWNPYFKDGEPCSIKLYQAWKKEKANG